MAAVKPMDALETEVKAFDSLDVKRSPALEFSFAWLKSNVDDVPEWWAILESSRQAISSIGEVISVRSGKSALTGENSGILQAEMMCLSSIATKVNGSVEAALAEQTDKEEEEEKPKRSRFDDDDDDDDEDLEKELSSLSTVEHVQSMQRFLYEKLGTDDPLTKILKSSLDFIIQDVQHGVAVETAEAVGLLKLLGHSTRKKCWACGADVGKVTDVNVPKLRSALCDLLRQDRLPVTTPGLLKHLLVVNRERTKLDGIPQSKL